MSSVLEMHERVRALHMHFAFTRHNMLPADLHCVYACMHCCACLSHALIFKPEFIREPVIPPPSVVTPPHLL